MVELVAFSIRVDSVGLDLRARDCESKLYLLTDGRAKARQSDDLEADLDRAN